MCTRVPSQAAPAQTTKMQVELTYKAEPTLTMTCIARVKGAEVCKEVDDESGVEFGEVDLRQCLEAILVASPELKKEEWSVYVLDQSAPERRFGGNGTITSVLKDDQPVPVVGKVSKRFNREKLEVELRLVKVPISPAKKQSTLSLEQLLPLALQHHSLQPVPAASSPVLQPPQSSPTLPIRRLLAPQLQQDTPPPSSFPPFSDQLWTDFEIPLQDHDFSNIFPEQSNFGLPWQSIDTATVEPLKRAETPSLSGPATFTAPIPPPPPPGPPTPKDAPKSRKRSSSVKDQKAKKMKKFRKELPMASSPPIRASRHIEDLDAFRSEGTTPAKFPETNDFSGPTWEEFLVQSDSEGPEQSGPAVPHVGFTAVNSTVESSREFTARQILLNSELTPASSPDQSQSPSGQTESESGSPVRSTLSPETPATQGPPTSRSASNPTERSALGDVTANITNVIVKEKRPRGRPKGWRKQRNTDNPSLPDILNIDAQEKQAKPRKQSTSTKEEPVWSERIRASIKDAMLEHLAKGELPPMCACCGDIQPTSWRYVTIDDKQERFCNACGLYYKKYGVLKPIPTSPPKRKESSKRRSKNRELKATTPAPTVEAEGQNELALCPSSPPQRTYELMSEIDHPLLSEGICLPRMGYLRGDNVLESCDDDDDDDTRENGDSEDEMERLFSDILA